MMFSPALIIRLCFFQITVDEPELEQGKALDFLRVINQMNRRLDILYKH